MKKFFYKLIAKYLKLYINNDSRCIEINPKSKLLKELLHNKCYDFIEGNSDSLENQLTDSAPDFIILNGNLHYEKDIQQLLESLKRISTPQCRIVVCYYSALWRPFIKLASWLGIRQKTPELNWFSPADLHNFALISGLEVIQKQEKILFPFPIPILNFLFNRILAPLPFFRWFTMVNIALLKTTENEFSEKELSVSVVIPARNEAGNIYEIFRRIPRFCNNLELIFIEGNSTDNTWEMIQKLKCENPNENILIAKQDGKGKGDAVRKGFAIANNDILMILDADMTVPPEDLSKFYRAIADGKGEFINGSRLVYPLENDSMRFFNIIGNKFFASAFSFVLRQRFKDTLCGTKVLSRNNYLRIAHNRSYFGDFDPFGDFDLLFGASRLGLKIVEIPVSYKARAYGETNIKRWKHGWLLLKMLIFACRKIKFI